MRIERQQRELERFDNQVQRSLPPKMWYGSCVHSLIDVANPSAGDSGRDLPMYFAQECNDEPET